MNNLENHEIVMPEEMMKMPRESLGPEHEHIEFYLNKSTLIWYNYTDEKLWDPYSGYHRYNGSEYPNSIGANYICSSYKEDQHELLLQNGYELLHEAKHYNGISRRYCKKVRSIKRIEIQFRVYYVYNSYDNRNYHMDVTMQFYSNLQPCQEAATGWHGVSRVKIDEESSKLFKILLTDAQIEAINNCIDEFNILCDTINLEHSDENHKTDSSYFDISNPSSPTIRKEIKLRGDINVKRYNL